MTGRARGDGITVCLVAAVADNGVIGHDGDMPWHLRDDLKWFKKNTLGKPVVMGRKTFVSIGKALPGRKNIVVSRDSEFAAENICVKISIEEAVRVACEWAVESGQAEVCIIGGGEIYAQTLAQANRLYLTRVHATIKGDTVFPPLDAKAWEISPHGEVTANDRNTHACSFYVFDRIETI